LLSVGRLSRLEGQLLKEEAFVHVVIQQFVFESLKTQVLEFSGTNAVLLFKRRACVLLHALE
jgi:hypothetical protein